MAKRAPKARAIPEVPRAGAGADRTPFDTALKENLEVLFGRVGEPIGMLPAAPTLAEVAAKLNEVIGRLR